MHESGNCSFEMKLAVACTVMNRVKDSRFPDTVRDVVNQEGQFTSVGSTEWCKLKVNDECYKAADMAINLNSENLSDGALYFESMTNYDNWHSRNLEFLYQIESMRFYR